MMRLSLAVLDQVVSDEQRERQIGQPAAVQVSQLTSPDPELGPAEPVTAGGDPWPRRDFARDGVVNGFTHGRPYWPAPARNSPRGVGVGRATISAPRIAIVPLVPAAGAC